MDQAATTETGAQSGATEPEAMWARVEIFGHRRHFGRVTEVERFGTKMLRVDVPAAEADRFDTFLYGGSSIFGITPMTEEAARAWAAEGRRYQTDSLMAALPPPRTIVEPYEDGDIDQDDGEAAHG